MKVHLLHNNLYYALLEEKAMAPHSSTLAWKIPWTEEPGIHKFGASLVVQMVKDLPAIQVTWVQSLGWEDPLEEGMATHLNILKDSME